MNKCIKVLLSFFMAITLIYGYGQESEGGIPFSFQNNLTKSTIDTKIITKPHSSILKNADKDSKGPFRIGYMVPVNINTVNSGTWESFSDGSRLWRLKVHADQAMALALHYSCIYLPDGAELFLYNEYENHVIGKFTSIRNFNNPITHTQMIQGEDTYLEYYEPAGISEDPIIQISNVAYVFRGVEDFVNPIIEDAEKSSSLLYEKADNCQVDVACSPENNGWSEQIDAAIHYTMVSGGWMSVCSASLLNNTSQDCTPYILSAWHCGENPAGTNLSGYTWYWNYQKSSCQPNQNSSNPSKGSDTKINGIVRASSGSGSLNNPPSTNQVAGSDFYLVELGSSVPTSYNAFYAGWNRANSGASSGVSVHHPAGSAKKISTFTSNLSSVSYNGGASNAHWLVSWSSTPNGHGVTEGGSSGSPIFDQNGRVVGQLSGGSSFCSNPTSPDLYGKFSTNWTANGSNAQAQLAPWLDPGNTGVNFMDGAYEPCNQSNPPSCAISVSSNTITAGGSVIFSDASTGLPTSWSWNFDNTSLGGVSPTTSSSQNPGSVTYSNPGTYEVLLTANNANGTCSTTVNITVNTPGSSSGCDTLINIASTDTLRVYSTNNGGYLAGWNGYGDFSKCEAYSNYSPFNSISGMEIYFYGVNDGGNGATVDFNVWDDNGGQPGSIIGTTQITLAALDAALAPNGGQGLYVVNLPSPISLNGGTIYCGITMNGFAPYPGGQDSLGIVTNSVYDPTANSGWEQWNDNTWHDMNSAWGVNISQYIRVILCGGCASNLIINPSTNNPTCNQANGSISITASGGSSPYQFSIDGGNTFQSSGTFNNLSAGTYNVIIEDASGCSETNVLTLTNVGGVTPTISSNQNICAGNSVSITAGGAGAGGSYLWDNGLGSGSSHVVSPASTTTYNVTITDINGCTATASVTITVDTPPSVSINPSTASICSGESITISASGAQSYSWNTGATTPSITVSPANQSTYTVIGQNGSCPGSPVSVTISVTQSPTVTASANPTTISVGGTVSFSSAGSGATSYVWDFGDGNTSTQNNPSHTYSSAGIYTVTLTGTLNGCINTSQLTINVGAVNINEYNLENAVSIIPNPNKGQFEININLNEVQDVEITLFNSLGQVIKTDFYREVFNNSYTYNINDQSKGIYYINVKSNKGNTTKRLLILD